MDNKQDFLNHLKTSFREYFAMENHSPIERAQAKSYINGLMVAGRIFGISFDELQQVMSQEQSQGPTSSVKNDWGNIDPLEIPTIFRNSSQHSK